MQFIKTFGYLSLFIIMACYRSISTHKGCDRIETQSIEDMIIDVQNGQTNQYASVVNTYQQSIFRYCLRLLGNRQDAEDATQDIFVKAYESIERYKPTVSFSAWLYKIAYHHSLNMLRQRRSQNQLLLRLFKPFASESESPEQLMDKNLFSPQLSAALAALSPEDRSLLILRIFEEKSFKELSEIIGKHPDALKKMMSRVKAKIKRVMRKWQEEEKWDEQDQIVNMNI